MPKAIAQTSAEAGTSQRLAAAAVELIAEQGWAAVTTRKVASRAGVNPGLVHYHYGSVATLRREAALAAMLAVFEPALAGLTSESDVDRALARAVAAIGEIDPHQPETIVSLEAMLQSQRDPELRDRLLSMLHEFRAALEERIAGAVDAGRVRPDLDPHGAVLLVAAAMDGLGLHRAIDPDTSLAPAAAALTTMLRQPA